MTSGTPPCVGPLNQNEILLYVFFGPESKQVVPQWSCATLAYAAFVAAITVSLPFRPPFLLIMAFQLGSHSPWRVLLI